MSDFTTDSMRFKATERYAFMYAHPRCFEASRRVVDERSPMIQFIAKRMARVVTPYWPCTDLEVDE